MLYIARLKQIVRREAQIITSYLKKKRRRTRKEEGYKEKGKGESAFSFWRGGGKEEDMKDASPSI